MTRPAASLEVAGHDVATKSKDQRKPRKGINMIIRVRRFHVRSAYDRFTTWLFSLVFGKTPQQIADEAFSIGYDRGIAHGQDPVNFAQHVTNLVSGRMRKVTGASIGLFGDHKLDESHPENEARKPPLGGYHD